METIKVYNNYIDKEIKLILNLLNFNPKIQSL